MVFGFGKKKKQAQGPTRSTGESAEQKRRVSELQSELAGLRSELEHLSTKLNVELRSGDGDRTTTLSRYPRRIIEVKIRIDEIERKLESLGAS